MAALQQTSRQRSSALAMSTFAANAPLLVHDVRRTFANVRERMNTCAACMRAFLPAS
jgi:hypothetical protein